MMRFTAIALAFVAAAATSSSHGTQSSGGHVTKQQRRYAKKVYKSTPGLPLATMGVFSEKKCHGFPTLVVETPRE
jgi:hypothetical protein